MLRDPRHLGRGGFTLVELAVALLIGALLVSVVFQMMSGQARLTSAQSSREEAQQNTRGALEIMSSELRSAIPAGILAAEAQSVTFMQPRAWGLLCSAAAATNVINVVFPDVGADAAWASGRANGFLVKTGAAAYVPAPAGGVAGRSWLMDSQELGAPTAANCPLSPSGNVTVVQLTGSTAVTAAAGSPVALYTLTRYDLGTVDGLLWLRRNSGLDANDGFLPQPLAGPLAADRFDLEYRDGAGTIIPAPVAAASLPNIRQVRVRVVTESSQRLNDTAQRDSGEAVVTLRNPN